MVKGQIEESELAEFYKDTTIVVTGGVGSIGTEIVKQLLKYGPNQIRIFDNRETEIFHLQNFLKEHKNIRYLLGDIRDKERLKRALKEADFVFHAAALKHVESCEYNPFEAVKTNIFGTQNLIEASVEEGLKKVIFISTDKAVNPINTMGATKLLAEKLIMNASFTVNPKFSCVRFGNVLESSGSVIPIFRKQIEHGGPLTITHQNMRRFFISIPQAVNLVLKCGLITVGREIFILKMNAFSIKDLAEVMIKELAPKYNHKPENIKIEITGIRPGEKMDELLMTKEESYMCEEFDNMFIIKPDVFFPHYSKQTKKLTPISEGYYDSEKAKLLTKEEIKKILKQENII